MNHPGQPPPPWRVGSRAAAAPTCPSATLVPSPRIVEQLSDRLGLAITGSVPSHPPRA